MKKNENQSLTVAEEQPGNQAGSNPLALIELALKQNADVDKLEKLMGLKERFDAIEQKKLFIAALSKFQREVPPIKKSRTGHNYKFASLEDIDNSIKDCLAANGLSKRWQINDGENGMIKCTCIISHAAGHSEETSMSAKEDGSGSKNAIQARGSSVTYLQRYTLIGALGLTTAQDDTDGQAGAKKSSKEPTANPADEISDLIKESIGKFKDEKLLMNYAKEQTHLAKNPAFRALVKAQQTKIKNG